MQNTCNLMMIKPINFGFNEETATNNAFQLKGFNQNSQEKALIEFDNLVKKLIDNAINVMVVNDTADPFTPDSIFPNNWISFHSESKICLYPMFAPNRRKERKPHILELIKSKFDFDEIIDFTHYEKDNLFLEGTGSMVLDRENKIAYACLSPRTDKIVFEDFCNKLSYKPIYFSALDENNKPIYHTNVVMCIADKYVIICLESIKNDNEKKFIIQSLENSGKHIIEISLNQMNNFAGNMLQVINTNNEQFLIMSTCAYNSLEKKQLDKINTYNKIIHSELGTIEKNGGGSARCMLAEIFLTFK